MSSLVDRLRASPPRQCSALCIGIDPDLHTLGWATLRAAWSVPATGPVSVTLPTTGIIKAKGGPARMGLDASQEMIAQLVAASSGLFRPNSIVVVEAQRIYPLPDEPMNKVVGKGNDLLRLAQVSGAAQALAQVFSARSVAVLPQEWKGNQKKVTTLYEVQQFFPGGVLWQDGQDSQPEAARLDHLPPRAEHGIDALGIAIYAARLISSNPEAYGF